MLWRKIAWGAGLVAAFFAGVAIIVGTRALVVRVPAQPPSAPAEFPLLLVASVVVALGGGLWFYFRRYAPRIARREIRPHITAGPVIRRLKVEFRPLVDKRVRELARELGLKKKKR